MRMGCFNAGCGEKSACRVDFKNGEVAFYCARCLANSRFDPNYTTITVFPGGAWLVFSYDTNAYPIALYDNEEEAGRKVNEQGYGSYKYWEFGTEWSN